MQEIVTFTPKKSIILFKIFFQVSSNYYNGKVLQSINNFLYETNHVNNKFAVYKSD